MTRKLGPRIIIVEPEPPRICEGCGAFTECRPYGPGGTQVCHPCAMKNPEEADRLFGERFGLPPAKKKGFSSFADRKAKREKKRLHRKPLPSERVFCPDCGKLYEGTREVDVFTCEGPSCGAQWREDVIVDGKVQGDRVRVVVNAEAKEDHTYRVPESRCPECDHRLDAASNFDKEDQRQPVPLDFTICMNCTAILRFRLDLSVRSTSLLEREHMPPGVLEMVKVLSNMFPTGIPKKNR